MSVAIIPFGIGFAVTLAQPALDTIWMGRFDDLYHAKDQALEGAAKWISDVAAFPPTAFLTGFGIFLARDSYPEDSFPWLVAAAGFVALATIIVYVFTVWKIHPERAKHGPYSLLQYWLMALNIAGAATASFVQ